MKLSVEKIAVHITFNYSYVTLISLSITNNRNTKIKSGFSCPVSYRNTRGRNKNKCIAVQCAVHSAPLSNLGSIDIKQKVCRAENFSN